MEPEKPAPPDGEVADQEPAPTATVDDRGTESAKPPDEKPEPRAGEGVEDDVGGTGATADRLVAGVVQFINSAGVVRGVGADPAPPVQRDGRLDESRLRSFLVHYLPPTPYDDAFTVLAEDHVVGLYGRQGIGKYAGGLHLLRDVTSSQIVLLPPVITLKELALRPYERGLGYLVVDRQSEGRTAETEFSWLTVRNQVKEAGSYLVVTSMVTSPPAGEVRHIEWAPPDLRRVLCSHTHMREPSDDVLDSVVEQLSGTCSVAEFVEVARQIARGVDHQVALARYDASAAADVRAWFDETHTRRETLEIATLAFADGVKWQVFEQLLGRLESHVAERIPVPEANPDAVVEDFLPQLRATVLTSALITQQDVADSSSIHQIIKFRKPGYRRRVLVELWNRHDSRFWDSVRAWACDTIDNYNALPAWGLAELAGINFDEVRTQFLDPWASGTQGWPGQLTATYVLWSMCYNDATAPIALGTAKRWANHGDPAQRWAAAVAFGGPLGACYPNEALRQLWQLIVNSSERTDACIALAVLFATLTYGSPDSAGKVVSMLNRRVESLEERRPGQRRNVDRRRIRELTMTSLLTVLSIQDSDRQRPAIFVYLNKRPEEALAVARLWATLLRYQPYRRKAMVALWEGLNALPRITKEPAKDAEVLAVALAAALLPAEHANLVRDLTTVDQFKRRGKAYTESMAVILLRALERLAPNAKGSA